MSPSKPTRQPKHGDEFAFSPFFFVVGFERLSEFVNEGGTSLGGTW